MRRSLAELWPDLTALFGLRPWDADPANPGCLTHREINAYLDAYRKALTRDPK